MSSYLEISEALYEQIEPMRTIDTHEHLFEEPTRLADQLDFSSLFDAYANADLVSAGMSSSDHDRFMSPATDLDEKWRMAAPYWEAARHTGYSTAIRLTIRNLYGADDLNSSTYGPITEKMRAANKPGVNRSVLHDKAGIDWCIVHNLDGEQNPFRAETDRSLFKQVIVVAKFFGQETMVQELADPTGVAPDSWSAYKRVIDWYFEQYGEDAVAIKNNCPYWRNLRFDSVSDEDAAAIFERQYVRGESVTAAETKALQDATFRYCIGRAIEYDLPVQIHTGYLAGNWGMDVNRIRATDLTNLFGEYHEARFDLFHISYPYHLELGTLAKNYPNVWLNFCWAWIIDPYASRQALLSYLTSVPINKIFAFGGDVRIADPAYGHLLLAKRQIALALGQLVAESYYSESEALTVARRILRDNAVDFFDL